MRVYIAAPYTRPDPVENTHKAILAANELLDLGYTPFLPHLTMFWHLVTPKPYEDWLKIDLDWLYACDVLLRLPGESSGADKEIQAAEEAGIPVVYTLEDLEELRGDDLG